MAKTTKPFVPKVLELFGQSTIRIGADWNTIVKECKCPFLNRRCEKSRKGDSSVLIGTCLVSQGERDRSPVIICPRRLLERTQIFFDCLHLLTLHQPGNEFHIIPEIEIPGGSVDYVLASVNGGKVKDFLGIELQSLDTTGTVWPDRQKFLNSVSVPVDRSDLESSETYGMNWKMTAKTILMQLHHKIKTFEHLSKHFVLVIQDVFLSYVRNNFSLEKVSSSARIGDWMQFHIYRVVRRGDDWRIELAERLSTDAAGVAHLLGLQADAKVELQALVELLESKLSPQTLLTLDRQVDRTMPPSAVPPPS